MELNEKTKKVIEEFYKGIDPDTDFDDAHELTIDYLIDNDIVDLSDDEDGDLYEELSNIVYYELENKTEEEIKEFFRTKSYGHPSSLMWRKFYFEILKPNFL